MRDVEEVMVGFESTVESCQECGTLALRAGAVPIQRHLYEISADFFGEKSSLHLIISAPSPAKYAMSS